MDTSTITGPVPGGTVELDPGSIGYGPINAQQGGGTPAQGSGGSGLLWLVVAAAAALAGS